MYFNFKIPPGKCPMLGSLKKFSVVSPLTFAPSITCMNTSSGKLVPYAFTFLLGLLNFICNLFDKKFKNLMILQPTSPYRSPNHINNDYAHFILAMCYYENIVDEKRDLDPLLNSKKEFELIIREYPDTDFALDAKFKLELIKERLAGKEMFIARHYLKTKKWIPAINRFKIILKNLTFCI